MTMNKIIQTLTDLFNEAIKTHDIESAEGYHRQLEEYRHMNNPMDDAQSDAEYTGLDPYQIDYAKKLANQMEDNKQMMLSPNMWMTGTGKFDPNALTAGPGSLVTGTLPGGANVVYRSALKPMAVFHEPTQADRDADKRRHLKLFVHFAKQFAERYPKWTVVPDEADPLHSVHLLMKDRGAMIHNLYPSNEMAVYGGPASWVEPRKELGQHLPIVKINTQEFWGWCVGMDDLPEWMI